MATPSKAEVTASSLNVRSGPGTTFSILTTVKRGTVLDVVEQQGDWIKVRINIVTGFVAAQFVQLKVSQPVSGFLIEQPELLEVRLTPDNVIPTDTLTGADLSVANTWNDFVSL